MTEASIALLPSVFSPFALREGGDAVARAVELAPSRGAGTLCWVRAYGRAEAAVVLEPETPLREARVAILAALAAAADVLGAYGPPEAPTTLRWPNTLAFNGAEVGQVRWATPPGAAEDAVPDWLVVGFELRLAWPPGWQPGLEPGRTSLEEEGFEPHAPADLVATWARHLMATLADLADRGTKAVADRVLARLEPLPGAPPGARRGLDPATGDLILEAGEGRVRVPLAAP